MPEDVRTVGVRDVALTAAVELEVLRHHARVVLEPVLEQELNRDRRELPARRPVADGPSADDALDRLEPALEDAALFGRLEVGRALVQVAVVADLVAARDDLAALTWKRVDRVAGHVEARGDLLAIEQRENATEPHPRAELAARQRGGRRRRVGAEPDGQSVEVEGQARRRPVAQTLTSCPFSVDMSSLIEQLEQIGPCKSNDAGAGLGAARTRYRPQPDSPPLGLEALTDAPHRLGRHRLVRARDGRTRPDRGGSFVRGDSIRLGHALQPPRPDLDRRCGAWRHAGGGAALARAG